MEAALAAVEAALAAVEAALAAVEAALAAVEAAQAAVEAAQAVVEAAQAAVDCRNYKCHQRTCRLMLPAETGSARHRLNWFNAAPQVSVGVVYDDIGDKTTRKKVSDECQAARDKVGVAVRTTNHRNASIF